mgnify:CR=1 FL=1
MANQKDLDKVYMSNLCLTGDSLVDIVVEDVSDVAISILEKYNFNLTINTFGIHDKIRPHKYETNICRSTL